MHSRMTQPNGSPEFPGRLGEYRNMDDEGRASSKLHAQSFFIEKADEHLISGSLYLLQATPVKGQAAASHRVP